MSKFTAHLLAASFIAASLGSANAQESIVLSVCQDGLNGSGSQTAEEMGRFLEGTWRMGAVGTGMTTGTNVMSVSLQYDPGTDTLMMEGVPLNPLQFTESADGSEVPDAPFDMSVEALTPAELSQDDLAILTGCGQPARYWWQMGSGANSSWGALMFFENDAAVGYMANSAGGSRNVSLTR